MAVINSTIGAISSGPMLAAGTSQLRHRDFNIHIKHAANGKIVAIGEELWVVPDGESLVAAVTTALVSKELS
jgi:hypothetical protein